MDKTVLVTGGAGYIGDSVVRGLLGQGCRVVVVDNLMYGGSYMRGLANTKLLFFNRDITDNLDDLFERFTFDAAIHLAAIVGDGACAVNPERTIEVNEKATENIARLCRENDVKMVFASTCSIYGANNDLLNEDSETNPLSLYAGTKLNAEAFVREVPRHTIFRLGTLFGLSTSHARIRCDLVVNILTYKAMQGQTLTVFGGDQWRPLLHVLDAGRCFVEAATIKDNVVGTFVLSHENYKVIDVAKKIRNVCSLVVAVSMKVTDSKFEDLRNYKVDRARMLEHFNTYLDLGQGIADMRDIMMQGRIADVWNTSFHNARYVKEVLNG